MKWCCWTHWHHSHDFVHESAVAATFLFNIPIRFIHLFYDFYNNHFWVIFARITTHPIDFSVFDVWFENALLLTIFLCVQRKGQDYKRYKNVRSNQRIKNWIETKALTKSKIVPIVPSNLIRFFLLVEPLLRIEFFFVSVLNKNNEKKREYWL